MASFTVFFCGTGSNSYDFSHTNSSAYFEGELVSLLASHHMGHEFVDWIIVDGPGSGNLQEAEKWVPSGNYSTIRGALTGKGWEENVKHAVAVLIGTKFDERKEHTRAEIRRLRSYGIGVRQEERTGWLGRKVLGPTKTVEDKLHPRISPQALQQKKIEILGKNKPIDVINAIGWSRGGVTCIMFANALAEVPGWKNVPVNIFALDPVPGAGNFQAKRTMLGGNVAHYVAVYARDERSMGFSPVLPFLNVATKRSIITMPGRHATLVGNAAVDGGGGVNTFFAPGKITRDLAEKWLTFWGTPLNKTLNYTQQQLLREYDGILADLPQYAEMRKTTYAVLPATSHRSIGVGPTISIDLAHPLLLPQDPIFVNSHHRWLFSQVHAGLFQKLFVRTSTPMARFRLELARLGQGVPNLTKRLRTMVAAQGRGE